MKKITLAIVLSLVTLFSIPAMAFAGGPPPPPSISDWSVIDITVTNQWITNQAGTPDATPWATDETQITVTVKNNNNGKWEPTLGRVTQDGIWIDVAGLEVTSDSPDTQSCNKGDTKDFNYTVKSVESSSEGKANVCVQYEGEQGIQILWFTIWGDWVNGIVFIPFCHEDFGGQKNNLFGVDNTSPTINANVVGHAVSGSEYGGARYWTTVEYSVFDQISGVKSITETVTPISGHNHPVLHTIIAIDNAGNISKVEVITSSSVATASIALCEKCWHSLYCGSPDDWKIQSVFAAGGWYFYTCPFCGYSSEKEQRARYAEFKERGGFIPVGDFDKGMNYKP